GEQILSIQHLSACRSHGVLERRGVGAVARKRARRVEQLERSQHGCSELGGPSCYLAEGLLDAFTEVSLTDRNGPFEPRVSRVAGLEVIRQRSRGNRVDLFLHLGT